MFPKCLPWTRARESNWYPCKSRNVLQTSRGIVFHILYPWNHLRNPGKQIDIPEKLGCRSGGNILHPRMTPNTSHNNKGKLWYPRRKASLHLSIHNMSLGKLGQSWFRVVVFFLRERYFHKNPRIYGDFRYFSPCNNIALIAHLWKASIGGCHRQRDGCECQGKGSFGCH